MASIKSAVIAFRSDIFEGWGHLGVNLAQVGSTRVWAQVRPDMGQFEPNLGQVDLNMDPSRRTWSRNVQKGVPLWPNLWHAGFNCVTTGCVQNPPQLLHVCLFACLLACLLACLFVCLFVFLHCPESATTLVMSVRELQFGIPYP